MLWIAPNSRWRAFAGANVNSLFVESQETLLYRAVKADRPSLVTKCLMQVRVVQLALSDACVVDWWL